MCSRKLTKQKSKQFIPKCLRYFWFSLFSWNDKKIVINSYIAVVAVAVATFLPTYQLTIMRLSTINSHIPVLEHDYEKRSLFNQKETFDFPLFTSWLPLAPFVKQPCRRLKTLECITRGIISNGLLTSKFTWNTLSCFHTSHQLFANESKNQLFTLGQ